jgi:hypothetical protein
MFQVLPVSVSALIANPDGQALLSAYREEWSLPGIGKPNTQFDQYQRMESLGVFKIFGLYVDSSLVGFASVLTSVHPLHGKKVAIVENLYVFATWRNGIGSAKLIRTIEGYAESSGCVAILYSAPAGSGFERTLEGQKEYSRTNSVFCRRFAGSAADRSIMTGMDIEKVDVLSEDLCAIYGCDRCPRWVKSEDGTPVFCTHECHRGQCDA